MSKLVARIQAAEKDQPIPVVAGIAHYVFVTIHPYFDGKGLFDERHQLDREQGIDEARFEQIVVVVQICDVNGTQYEAPDGFLDAIFFSCID